MMRETIIASEVRCGCGWAGSVPFTGKGLSPGAPAGLAIVGGRDADPLLEHRTEVAERAVTDVEADLGDGEGAFQQEFLAVVDAQFGEALIERLVGGLAEEAGQMGGRETDYGGQVRPREGTAQVVAHEGLDAPDDFLLVGGVDQGCVDIGGGFPGCRAALQADEDLHQEGADQIVGVAVGGLLHLGDQGVKVLLKLKRRRQHATGYGLQIEAAIAEMRPEIAGGAFPGSGGAECSGGDEDRLFGVEHGNERSDRQ